MAKTIGDDVLSRGREIPDKVRSLLGEVEALNRNYVVARERVARAKQDLAEQETTLRESHQDTTALEKSLRKWVEHIENPRRHRTGAASGRR